MTTELTHKIPLTRDVRVNFFGFDTGPDNVVEVGVDNFRLEGDFQECDPLGVIKPPNSVGDSVRLTKIGDDAVISWDHSPVDAAHDAAAYYCLYVSAAADAGFGLADTATSTLATRVLDPSTEYFLVTAVNAAGTSNDEPTP